MAIVAGVYRRAAEERAAEAVGLHGEGRYALAHYVAGLAVECMLRAYRVRVDPQFDSRHDLRELCRAARFYQFLPTEDAPRVSAALAVVADRWRNDHRYRDERELRHWLKDLGRDRHVRGDILKHSSREIVNAAVVVVTAGGVRWESGS
ncbi:MAG: HEPN domain-containing protein [Gemmatimonadetes bacterium]|nr:HEPN domain-containing protein [Gemmatimonadota bacterium]